MEEIGRRLRQAREARGITLETAEEETKIRRRYIEALEVGRVADLPGEVYVKGFLRTYGNYLGLDGPELVEAYKLATERVAVETQPAGAPDTVVSKPSGRPAPSRPERVRRPRPSGTAPDAGASGRIQPDRRPASSRGIFMVLLVVALAAGLSYLGWMIFSQVGGGDPTGDKPPEPPQSNQPKVPSPTPKLPDPPKVIMAPPAGDKVIFTVPAKQIQVQLELSDPAWLQATVDGVKKHEGTTRQTLTLEGAQISIRMGHMNGVSVVVNGQRFDKPLQSGPYTLIFSGEQ